MVRVTLIAVTAAFLGLGALFVLRSIDMISWSYFGKWAEDIRHDIQKESVAYRDGMKLRLGDLMVAYQSADAAGKVGIAQIVRHEFSQLDTSDFPPHLREFLGGFGL